MKPLLIVLMLGRAADATTSLAAFHYGAIERNPLVISTQPAPFVAQTVLETAGEVWVLRKIAGKHPKWAKTLAVAQIAASFTVASLNARDVPRQRDLARGIRR